MNNRLTAIILAITVTVGVAYAAEKVNIAKLELKSLPADIYTKLNQGKRASLLWRDATFVQGSPYTVEKVEWLAADRNGSLSDYLTKELQGLGQKDGAQYRVQVRVTRYVDPVLKMFGSNVPPQLIVEAVVLDKSGAVVAAMLTAEKGSYLGGHLSPVNGLVDKVVSALDSEVMKGR